MTPPMYMRVRNVFESAKLTSPFTFINTLSWNDTGKLTDSFIVFRPSGGSDIQYDRAGDSFVQIDLIGAKGKNSAIETATNNIVEWVSGQIGTSTCIGAVRLLGGIPQPVMTTEGRLVMRLMLCCTYGE
ncbi:hypothetical protein [uncultured Cedecea sp.]|uniref:phage tail termination protein n=1 Tax=uncultured Cedecea sp. TaxID=988762 RepID=UPI0026389F26|nr:hypothetical protein [uncultured Cedecea sp.]